MYDIVTAQELKNITDSDILKEANTEGIIKGKVQCIAKGLVEGKYKISDIYCLLVTLSDSRAEGTPPIDLEENKKIRAKYGTSDYMYYTIFMGAIQNHPLINRMLTEYDELGNGSSMGKKEVLENMPKLIRKGELSVVRDKLGNVLVFMKGSLAGYINNEEGSVIEWSKAVSSKHLPVVGRLIKQLSNTEVELDQTEVEQVKDKEEALPW